MNIFSLIFAFIITTFIAILQPSIFPLIRLLAYAPLFALLCMKTSRQMAMFVTIITGLIIDLCTTTPFGFNCLIYSLTMLLMYDQKKFFADKILSLSLYTIFISVSITIIRYVLCFIFSLPLFFSFYTILSDIILMPILDGIYGMILIFIPIKILRLFVYNY
jgi:rod shape-determining protein MreD